MHQLHRDVKNMCFSFIRAPFSHENVINLMEVNL